MTKTQVIIPPQVISDMESLLDHFDTKRLTESEKSARSRKLRKINALDINLFHEYLVDEFPDVSFEMVGIRSSVARGETSLASTKYATPPTLEIDPFGTAYIIRRKATVNSVLRSLEWDSISTRCPEIIVSMNGLVIPVTLRTTADTVAGSIRSWMTVSNADRECQLQCGTAPEGLTFLICPRAQCLKTLCSECFVSYSRALGPGTGSELECAFCKEPYFGKSEQEESRAARETYDKFEDDNSESDADYADDAALYPDYTCCGSGDFYSFFDMDSTLAGVIRDGGSTSEGQLASNMKRVLQSMCKRQRVSKTCDVGDIVSWARRLLEEDNITTDWVHDAVKEVEETGFNKDYHVPAAKVIVTWMRGGLNGDSLIADDGPSNAIFSFDADGNFRCTTRTNESIQSQVSVFDGSTGATKVLRVGFVARTHRQCDDHPLFNCICMHRVQTALWDVCGGFTVLPLGDAYVVAQRAGWQIPGNADDCWGMVDSGPASVLHKFQKILVDFVRAEDDGTCVMKIAFGMLREDGDHREVCRYVAVKDGAVTWFPRDTADLDYSLKYSPMSSVEVFCLTGPKRICQWMIIKAQQGGFQIKRLSAAMVREHRSVNPVTGGRKNMIKGVTCI